MVSAFSKSEYFFPPSKPNPPSLGPTMDIDTGIWYFRPLVRCDFSGQEKQLYAPAE